MEYIQGTNVLLSTLFVCPVYDTINGQSLSMSECFTVASKRPVGTKQDERAGLPSSQEGSEDQH